MKETPPDHCVAGLQEELISVKMREAEANLSLKEMRQKIADLQTHWEVKFIYTFIRNRFLLYFEWILNFSWQKYVSQTSTQVGSPIINNGQDKNNRTVKAAPGSTPSPPNLKDLQDQLMAVRMREAETFAELKEMRQRVMELETQNHVCTNQIRRQDEEFKNLTAEHELCIQKERELQSQVTEQQHKLSDCDSRVSSLKILFFFLVIYGSKIFSAQRTIDDVETERSRTFSDVNRIQE